MLGIRKNSLEKIINQIFFIIYFSLYPKYVDLSKGLPLECNATFYNPKYKYTANRRKMKYKINMLKNNVYSKKQNMQAV